MKLCCKYFSLSLLTCFLVGGFSCKHQDEHYAPKVERLPRTASPQNVVQLKSTWPVPFVLPYDDHNAGITHFGERLNHRPAGKYGHLSIKDGHFYVGQHRLRFWGVNVTAHSCFPEKDEAEKIAARMAKFGINIVRFHHMEANWGGDSLIDYSTGNSRNFHQANLDKLDYFVAQLKAQGIYSNLNILTSRDFKTADGLPRDIEKLAWKQRHILGYILPQVRDLEKEHARKLLTHKNPYTGLSYAQDPAVAIVEINNENSILQQYLDGSIDSWPAAFTAVLQQKWNGWLLSHYEPTHDLSSAWGVIDKPLGREMLINGDFANGTRGWRPEQHSAAVVRAIAGNYGGEQGLKLSVIKAGSASWHAQLNQGRLQLKAGEIYTLDFKVRASKHSAVSVVLQQSYSPWQVYDSQSYPLSNTWQQHRFTFVAGVDEASARLNFGDLGAVQGDFYLADVSLKPGGQLGKLAEGENLANKNIRPNKKSERYPQQRVRDWMRFLLSMEHEYWTDMHSFLVDELNIKALPYGTIVSLSPPSVQKQFGFIDAHEYWQHPVFPNKPWDSIDWTVSNTSIVNTQENLIDSLSRQKLKGMPFTVSEYQHCLPNSYMAEGPLLAAAYGAFQDWDGIYFFSYEHARKGGWADDYFSNFVQTNNHPSAMANFAIASNLFRRGDIAAAKNIVSVPFNAQLELDIISTQGRAWSIATGNHLTGTSGVAYRHGIELDTDLSREAAAGKLPSKSKLLISDTQQLAWDTRRKGEGVITIDSPGSKAVLGYIAGKTFSLGTVTLEIGQLQLDWATLALSAQSGDFDKLDSGATILVVATAKTENTDMQWKDSNMDSLGKNWGRAPTLIEVVPFSVSLPLRAARVSAWALDETGNRKEQIRVQASGANAKIIVDGSSETLWYEIEVSAEPHP